MAKKPRGKWKSKTSTRHSHVAKAAESQKEGKDSRPKPKKFSKRGPARSTHEKRVETQASPPSQTPGDDEEWVYGVHPVGEWLNTHTDQVEELIISSERKDQVVSRFVSRANEAGILIRYRPKTFFERLFPRKNHQGLAVRCRQFEYADLEDLIHHMDNGPMLFLTGIQDPGNLGAIIRSARAFGAHALLLSQRDSCPVNSTVIRASAGATASLPIALVRNSTQAVLALKDAGWWILGLALGGEVLSQFDMERPAVLLLGEEGKGLKPSLQKHCDALLEIPMAAGWDSLNVATCGAVVLYEWARQSNYPKKS